MSTSWITITINSGHQFSPSITLGSNWVGAVYFPLVLESPTTSVLQIIDIQGSFDGTHFGQIVKEDQEKLRFEAGHEPSILVLDPQHFKGLTHVRFAAHAPITFAADFELKVLLVSN